MKINLGPKFTWPEWVLAALILAALVVAFELTKYAVEHRHERLERVQWAKWVRHCQSIPRAGDCAAYYGQGEDDYPGYLP